MMTPSHSMFKCLRPKDVRKSGFGEYKGSNTITVRQNNKKHLSANIEYVTGIQNKTDAKYYI